MIDDLEAFEAERLAYLERVKARMRGEPEPHPPDAKIFGLAPAPSPAPEPSCLPGETAREEVAPEPDEDVFAALGVVVSELDENEARGVLAFARNLIEART